MRVQVPPRTDAYDNGINSFDGEVRSLRATCTKIGRKNATSGVLFINADSPHTGAINRNSGVPCLGRPSMARLMNSMAPVVCNPVPTTSSPAIVKIASLENPVRAVFMSITWKQTRVINAASMISSAAIFS